MSMIFRNLRSFLRGHPLFFLLTVLCITASAMLMLFGYGMYQNYMLEQQAFDANSTTVFFDHPAFNSEDSTLRQKSNVMKAELDRCLKGISDDTMNQIECFTVDVYDNRNDIPTLLSGGAFTHFHVHDGQFLPVYEVYENGAQWKGASGRFFTDGEYAGGKKLVTLPPNMPLPAQDGFYQIGDAFTLGGTEFTVIALLGAFPTAVYTALPDTMLIGTVQIRFLRPPTYAQYTEVRQAFTAVAGRLVMTGYTPFYDEDYWLYHTILLVSVLIAAVAAFNLVVLYQYILLKRQKTLAICQLCGCTKGRAILMYSAESVLLMIPSYVLAAVSFHFILLPLLKRFFPYMATAYSLRLYAVAFIILISVCTAAMLLLSAVIAARYSIIERKGGLV